MQFKLNHTSINVLDLEKSLKFYEEALCLKPVREIVPEDGSFKLIFLGDGISDNSLELTWLRDRTEPYDLGDNEIHVGFVTEDYDAAYAKHKEMACICHENPDMGLYFIEDPDGYWMEVVPKR